MRRRGVVCLVFLVSLVHLVGSSDPANKTDRIEVKKVARELLDKLKQLLVINWRQKATARSQVKLAIEDLLDHGLPHAYFPDLYQQKCSAVFEHFYETYGDRGVSIYPTAG